MAKMKMVLVSGVAGAGKTSFASVCEEKGYHVIEELPVSMIPSLLDVFKARPEEYAKNALFVNIVKTDDAAKILRADDAFDTTVVGLDCSREVLLTRFRLTRHIHPLQPKGYTLEEALEMDEKAMKEIQPSSRYLHRYDRPDREGPPDKKPITILGENKAKLNVVFSSFGYKYGLPRDAEDRDRRPGLSESRIGSKSFRESHRARQAGHRLYQDKIRKPNPNA
jgi:UPF0042 nucleotide-binding protein